MSIKKDDMNIKANIKGKVHDNIYLDVELEIEHIIDGGVYAFCINEGNEKKEEDKKILYVGETNWFIRRISQHIAELKNDISYFGLKKLEKNYTITLKILHDKLPLKPYEDVNKNGDSNRKERRNIEIEFLNKNKSLTQYDPNSDVQDDNMLNNEAPDYKLDMSLLLELEPDNFKKLKIK